MIGIPKESGKPGYAGDARARWKRTPVSHNGLLLLRHKLGVRVAATAVAAFYASWVVLEPSARSLVLLAGAALVPVSAWRGQVTVEDGVVRHRGLFGGGRTSVTLPQLTNVSLRRQFTGRHYPLTLKMEDSLERRSILRSGPGGNGAIWLI